MPLPSFLRAIAGERRIETGFRAPLTDDEVVFAVTAFEDGSDTLDIARHLIRHESVVYDALRGAREARASA